MRVVRQTYTTINKKTGERETRTAKRWYIIYRDHLGKERKIPGYRDKQASEAKGIELERQAERIAAGLLPVEVLAEPKSMAQHLEDFLNSLRASQLTPEHVELRNYRIKRVIDAGQIDSPSRIDGERIRVILGGWITSEEVSPRTANHYLAAVHQFAGYLVRVKSLPSNPLSGVEKWDAERSRKRVRRVISEKEFERLIRSTRRSKIAKPLPPQARAVLYLVAAYSGYRASELQSLRVGQIIRGERVSLPIPAAVAKNRKAGTIPLPDFVAKELLGFVSGRKAEEQIWPGSWADSRQAGKMLQRDLSAAKIPYVFDGKYFDFHSLRCQYATSLLRAGVPLAHAQKLMRHSTPALTMSVYAKLGLEDLVAEVSKMDRKKPKK